MCLNLNYMTMKIRTFVLAIAAMAAAACGQTAEEKVKAYEEAHEVLMTEYKQMMDSLSTDRQAQEEYYNDFVEKYIDFNLEAATSLSGFFFAASRLKSMYFSTKAL